MRITDNAIGGYFELEISDNGSVYHNTALALNSGRNAFEYILRCKKYQRIHIPYFTCEVLLQPVKKLNIEYSFYHINETFIPILTNYQDGDAILYTNYYGLNQKNIELLVKKYKHLIIDNSQALFDFPIENISTFYSPRKFLGLPDGGFVYGANEIKTDHYEIDSSLDRFSHLLCRIENDAESGYDLFKINDAKLDNQPIKLMSKFTKKLLNGVNFNKVIQKRISNFNFIHDQLNKTNKLTSFIDQSKMTCPLVYPYWVENGAELRKSLTTHRIYTAIYWPNTKTWCNSDSLEYRLTDEVVYLPIDQRYCFEELNEILQYV